MGMATRLAGRDYGVHARVDGWLGTGQAPKRIRRGNKEEPHGENTSKEDHREVEFDEKREREESACECWQPGFYLRVFILLATM